MYAAKLHRGSPTYNFCYKMTLFFSISNEFKVNFNSVSSFTFPQCTRSSAVLGYFLSRLLICCCRFVSKSCLTLCNPKNPPGSSVHRISQAKVLEWVAISYSRGSSRHSIEHESPVLRVDSLLLSHQGSPEDSISINICPYFSVVYKGERGVRS